MPTYFKIWFLHDSLGNLAYYPLVNLDEIGPWSEIKLGILRDYAGPYSKILASNRLRHGYIDAFSGPGLHVRKKARRKSRAAL